ncbi:helix-turn-helix domain containing protein (plasmid) [Streptomyces globisporus]|uniref:helix-turn-helix domain-containing protein n=1 Tax=Streptomyces globisporus TaxID=1908 RepID=UPI002F90D7EF|nr:helix-turn-helix domain containing protein [Streptomyces globisporus]
MRGLGRRARRRLCGCWRCPRWWGGRDRVEVAALFKVSAGAVDNWWAKWRAGGRDALLSRTRGSRVGEHKVHPASRSEPTN